MKMIFYKKYCMNTWNQVLIFATLKNCWDYWNLNSFSPAYEIVWILLIKQNWLFIKINKLKISIVNVKPTHYSHTSLIVSLEMEIKRTLNSLYICISNSVNARLINYHTPTLLADLYQNSRDFTRFPKTLVKNIYKNTTYEWKTLTYSACKSRATFETAWTRLIL